MLSVLRSTGQHRRRVGGQLTRYGRWCRDGHLSSTDRCFDVGITVRSALVRFEKTGDPWCGSTDPMSAGNGSIMRLAPAGQHEMDGRNARKPLSGLEEARRTFSGAGLSLPPTPKRFESDLRMTDEWCFSTRAINPGVMYMFDDYLWEALTGQTPDYLAFSHAGHGINSYALNYHLIDGPVVLMVQAPWGGIYMDDAETKRVIAQFQRCGELLEAVERAKARGLSPQSGRLCVFESELRGNFAWGWLDQPLGDEDDARTWIRGQKLRGADERVGSVPDHELPTNAAREWLDGRSFVEPPHYPDRKQHDLSDEEKQQIRKRLEAGEEETHALPKEFGCALTQIAAIKAWMKR